VTAGWAGATAIWNSALRIGGMEVGEVSWLEKLAGGGDCGGVRLGHAFEKLLLYAFWW